MKIMFANLPVSQNEALHNLINLHLFPECTLWLGQFDHCEFRGAEIVWERTGNLYSSGRNATTYCYNIDGHGFSLCALAVWPEDQATADVHAVAITPDDDEAREALQDWLARTVTGQRSRRDVSGISPH